MSVKTGCVSPITLKRKNPSVFGSITRQVPCGRCHNCLSRKMRGWVFRLKNEALVSTSVKFITLTYNDDNLIHTGTGRPTLHKEDFVRFIKRVRKNSNVKGIKYYACGEYGAVYQRPHYHAILFNLPEEYGLTSEYDDRGETRIQRDWKRGAVQVVNANENTMGYVCKYLLKPELKRNNADPNDDRVDEFTLMSKGLGANFMTHDMTEYLKSHLNGNIKQNGYNMQLPRYYKEAIFSKEERAIIRRKAERYREECKDSKIKWDERIRLDNEYIKESIRKFEQKQRDEYTRKHREKVPKAIRPRL